MMKSFKHISYEIQHFFFLLLSCFMKYKLRYCSRNIVRQLMWNIDSFGYSMVKERNGTKKKILIFIRISVSIEFCTCPIMSKQFYAFRLPVEKSFVYKMFIPLTPTQLLIKTREWERERGRFDHHLIIYTTDSCVAVMMHISVCPVMITNKRRF